MKAATRLRDDEATHAGDSDCMAAVASMFRDLSQVDDALAAVTIVTDGSEVMTCCGGRMDEVVDLVPALLAAARRITILAEQLVEQERCKREATLQ